MGSKSDAKGSLFKEVCYIGGIMLLCLLGSLLFAVSSRAFVPVLIKSETCALKAVLRGHEWRGG